MTPEERWESMERHLAQIRWYVDCLREILGERPKSLGSEENLRERIKQQIEADNAARLAAIEARLDRIEAALTRLPEAFEWPPKK